MNINPGIVGVNKDENRSPMKRAKLSVFGIKKRDEYYIVAIVVLIAYFISYLWFSATPGNLEQYFMGWFG